MAAVTLPFGVRSSMEFELDGQLVVNVYHAQSIETVASINLTNLANAVGAWWEDFMSANFSQDIALNRVIAKDISEVDGEQYELFYSTPVPGQSTGASLPNNVAACIGWTTSRTGRSYRGRSYYAGLPESIVTANTIAAPNLAAIVADCNELVTAVSDVSPFSLVVASFYNEGAVRTEGVGTPITGMSANDIVDSQRRRLPGRGT